MGYAGLGTPRVEWAPTMEAFLARPHDALPVRVHFDRGAFEAHGLRTPFIVADEGERPRPMVDGDVWALFPDARNSNATAYQRDLAATLQRGFETVTRRIVEGQVLRAPPDAYDGVAVGGGCALNVLSNSDVERTLAVPVAAPPAPNDCGLAVGAAWHVQLPPERPRGLAYAGPRLFDEADVDALLASGRFDVERDVGVDALADLLAGGRVIGVARGAMEFGPRALGHRSLLADPSRPGSKDRLNAVKRREWWRPTAPVVAFEDALRVFETLPRSPYMSFAPRLAPAAAAALPGIAHFDGTARPQVATRDAEPWLHALLLAVKRRSGWAALINTSFNTKGRPILNTAREALALLEADGLDGVLIEDVLVTRKAAR